MKFLSAAELSEAIREITREPEVRCAVAFWGAGAEQLFEAGNHANIRIICNLKMGGTNPFVVERLGERGFQVRQHDTLHAKVYLGETAAVVASANASANGLGFEGTEQASWREAGLWTEDRGTLQAIGTWFDSVWQAGRTVTDGDLKRAKQAWNARRTARPSLQQFADLELENLNLPLINWFMNVERRVNPALRNGIGRGAFQLLTNRIENGIDIEGPNDRVALTPGTWVLQFQLTNGGAPDRRTHLSWTNVGPIVENAFRYEGENHWRSIALAAESPGPEPFSIQNLQFRRTFFQVIEDETFQKLRNTQYRGAWYTPERLNLIRSFWAALRDRVNQGH